MRWLFGYLFVYDCLYWWGIGIRGWVLGVDELRLVELGSALKDLWGFFWFLFGEAGFLWGF